MTKTLKQFVIYLSSGKIITVEGEDSFEDFINNNNRKWANFPKMKVAINFDNVEMIKEVKLK